MKKRLFLLISAFLFIVFGYAQNDFLTLLSESLQNYNNVLPQEKVYVQTDKTLYTSSEGIFFKVFLSDANTNKPSSISDVVYVQLRNPKGTPIAMSKLSTQSGTAGGAFVLGDSLPGGIYTLVAYTRWMKNFGEETFFHKEITVQKVIAPRILLKLDFEKKAYGPGDTAVADLKVTDLNNVKTTGSRINASLRINGSEISHINTQSIKGETELRFILPENLSSTDGVLQIIVSDKGEAASIARSVPIILNKIDLQFLPEGGNMVAGVPCNVAFKAVNEFGKGADVSGDILDSKGIVVAQFKSFHLGMGSFMFKPVNKEQYKARIRFPKGNYPLVPLPEVADYKFMLNLRSRKNDTLTWAVLAPYYGQVCLVAQTQGVKCFSESITVNPGLNQVQVNTKDFPQGVSVFTLFNRNHEPVCERLVFVNPEKGMNVSINKRNKIYAPGDSIELKIKTTDKNGRPVAANLGLAVVDEKQLTYADDKQDNILSYLLFSSELSGKIQEPNFYFDEEEPKAKQAIDYLMLTQGWRRFSWNDVWVPNKEKIIYSAEMYSNLSGFVLDKYGRPTQAEVFLIECGGKYRVAKLKTNSEGAFLFGNVDVSIPKILVTKLPNQVYLFSEELNNGTTDNGDANFQGNLPELKNMLGTTFIENIVAKQAKENEAIKQLKEQELKNRQTFSADEALQGKIPGVQITQTEGSPDAETKIRVRGGGSLTQCVSPLYLVDGFPVQDINNIAPTDIESIDVLKDNQATSIFGAQGANGVIVITTKQASGNVRDLVASISTVAYDAFMVVGPEKSRENVFIMPSYDRINHVINGEIPGLYVQAQSVIPKEPDMLYKGMSSMAGGTTQPTLFVNQIPLHAQVNLSGGFDLINSLSILSADFMKGYKSDSIVGLQNTNNGAINFETDNKINNSIKIKPMEEKPNFGGILIPVKQFYKNPFKTEYSNQSPESSTAYWNSGIVTNSKGEATVTFRSKQRISTDYRITTEGISSQGLIGMKKEHVVVQKPFSIDAKIPYFAAIGDKVEIPVVVKNSTKDTLEADIEALATDNLGLVGCKVDSLNHVAPMNTFCIQHVKIASEYSKNIYFHLSPKEAKTHNAINIIAHSGSYADTVAQDVTLKNVFYPKQYSFSGQNYQDTGTVDLSGMVDGTLRANAVVYFRILDQLFDGAESIFQSPHGCFEQLSSSTFPNIFALQFLKTVNRINSRVEQQALEYIKSGYKSLAADEVSGGGFDWYGSSPAHTALSAYGLIEFYEMNKVYPYVDKAMIDRDVQFLLSKKDGKGGFKQFDGRYDLFRGIPENVNNAYIVYALCETGHAANVKLEYKKALKEALETKDLYRMALMANAAYDIADMPTYKKLIQYFSAFMDKNDFDKIKAQTSIMQSSENCKRIETVSFWLLAFIKNRENFELIERCVNYLNSNRIFGGFGNSQATSIALQSLTQYALFYPSISSMSGAFDVSVNDTVVSSTSLSNLANFSQDSQKLNIDLSTKLRNSQNKIGIKLTNVEKKYSYGINVSWQTKISLVDNQCPLDFSTRLKSNTMKVNETMRLAVHVGNRTSAMLYNPIVVIGIPGGVSLQTWQLKELQEKGLCDYYEIVDNNLILYYRSLSPKEVKDINLDVKAELPGRYTGVASSAYLYYSNEHKNMQPGLSVDIKE